MQALNGEPRIAPPHQRENALGIQAEVLGHLSRDERGMQSMPDAAVVIDSVDPAMTCDLMARGLPVVELTQCGGRPVAPRYH
ncbi:hypothetical protein SPISAL_01990 [Spiribacter salinus M19-40]|uniref:Uncharacterized protein n=1 Tax=Spiribacter salinus M19-40 TaxID=1260251 RepID=R4VIT0_9GAMM|nr:hypothetical protein [Spiribacter salinus]AGM40497.1 hypothetical protein SPISAL_01990 [Spiribacter salinus M19-40]